MAHNLEAFLYDDNDRDEDEVQADRGKLKVPDTHTPQRHIRIYMYECTIVRA